MAAARIQCWALKHANADALSQLPLPAKTVFAMELLNSTPVSVNEIRTGTRRDPIQSQVITFVQQGWLNHNSDEALKPYFTRKDELSVQDACLLWGNRVVVPPKERARVVEELHEVHLGICRMKAFAKNRYRLGAKGSPVQSLPGKEEVTAGSYSTPLAMAYKTMGSTPP